MVKGRYGQRLARGGQFEMFCQSRTKVLLLSVVVILIDSFAIYLREYFW